jgi:hypothetical protein
MVELDFRCLSIKATQNTEITNGIMINHDSSGMVGDGEDESGLGEEVEGASDGGDMVAVGRPATVVFAQEGSSILMVAMSMGDITG